MSRTVIGIAAPELVVDRHGPVSGNRQCPEELFQVRSVVLVVPKGDFSGLLSTHPSTIGVIVPTGEGQGGGIVVKLVEIEVEFLYYMHYGLSHHRRAVGIEESI